MLSVGNAGSFFGKCTEQPNVELVTKIQENLVTVLQMTQEELRQVITKPAQRVELEVERELVTQMIADVEGASSNLPLLQYVLTELWQQRILNRLVLSEYFRLGGLQKALEKQANQVYESFLPEQQQVAKRIFLALTWLGEETETTRRRVRKQDLVTTKQSEALVEQVIERLVDAKLLVTSEQDWQGERYAIIDIAHEALIRHWQMLRNWLRENRKALLKKQDIEDAAEDWQNQGKPVDLAFLLQGRRLEEAEEYLQIHADNLPLSSLAQEFVRVSQIERDRQRLIVETEELGATALKQFESGQGREIESLLLAMQAG